MDSNLDYWQATKHTVALRNNYILETGQFSDCNIVVGEGPQQQILKVHKLILAKASRVFEAMFYGKMAETNDMIEITDVQPETFKIFLEYIYTDVINVQSFEQACELCYCAKKYMFPFLIEECTKFILTDLSPNTACRAYEFAKLIERPVLTEKCLEFIRRETKSVLKDPTFETIQLETMLTIFEQEQLNVDSEIELLAATERWARSECVRKGLDPENSKFLRSVVGNAISKIRFLTVTAPAFAEGSVGSLLLNEHEVCAILRNIAGNNLKWPMPEGLSTDLESRVCPPEQQPTRSDLSVESTNIKRYCRRKELGNLHIDIRNGSINSLPFKINGTMNRSIRIIGVQIPTRFGNGFLRRYDEQLFFELFDYTGSRLTRGYFKQEVAVDSMLTVEFDKPGYVREGMVYHIEVVFITGGIYRAVSYADAVSEVQPYFSFGYEETGTHALQSGLIHSIVYTID